MYFISIQKLEKKGTPQKTKLSSSQEGDLHARVSIGWLSFFPPEYLKLLILNSTDRGSQVLSDAFLTGGGPRISLGGKKTLSMCSKS